MSKKLLDITFSNRLIPRKGRVLLSDPFLGDEYFERSVVYLCEHSSEGSFGFVLNNFIDVPLQQLNENFPDLVSKVSIGGPVEKETMYFIHSMKDELNESISIDNGVYIGGDFDQLYNVIQAEHLEQNKIRFFLGYSGWDAGQLANEIKENAWIVSTVESPEEIMNVNEPDLWKYFMNKLGKKYQIISQFPIDPSEN